MNVDATLLVNMIACGIQAAGEQLGEPLEITVNEPAATVYVATRDKRIFRVHVEAIGEEARHGS